MTMPDSVALKRTLSLPQLVLYGLGTTIGAGIYALVGEMAAISGYYAPVSFLLASVMAALTALSFAELSGRYPRCAGAALYVKEGFSSERMSTIVGLLVFAAALVSSAAIVNGFIAYLGEFIALDRFTAIIIVTLALGSIAAWGIAESVSIAAFVTVVEIAGLLLVIAVSYSGLSELPDRWQELVPATDSASWYGIYAGSLLAFYAFIGFEDMVNVAEEVRNPARNVPLAILIALGVTTLLYAAISLTAVLTVAPQQLAASDAPLATVYQQASGSKPVTLSIISIFAVVNGALIQIIMGSRILYGMSRQGWLPTPFGHVWRKTQTPATATIATAGVVLVLALWLPLVTLAKSTSFLVLFIFSLINLSLLRIKWREPHPQGVRPVPQWVPAGGIVASLGLLLFQVFAG